ncbi:hypothetical protein [Thermopirellula anaerolimosa]
MTLIELYRGFARQEVKACRLIDQMHWFAVNAEFDPRTGEALPQMLTGFLARVASEKQRGRRQDRLQRIIEHSRLAVGRLFRTLNERPRREHSLLPVRSVRELDAACFVKLSTRPGRNIREKLAGRPYLQAVRRYQSVDLLENRLLKAYVALIAELLELRNGFLCEPEDDLLVTIRRWLTSDEARSIGEWQSVPPNNTLLTHRDYRRVWDSWRRLQTIDDDIARDLSRLEERQATVDRWREYARIYCQGTHRFAEMPVLFNYEEFTIRTWDSKPLFRISRDVLRRTSDKKQVPELACVDLAAIRPRFAVKATKSWIMTDTYVWQQWRRDTETVDITLFTSDAVYLHRDATTIALPELLLASDEAGEHGVRAAQAFAARLRETFTSDALIWLVPDGLNDFELDIIRRNLNAYFPNAEPLPRSIAAVFEEVDWAAITNDGYSVAVVDNISGETCVTKLVARYDPELQRLVPETKGYYWERQPPVLLSKVNRDHVAQNEWRAKLTTVDDNDRWHDAASTEPLPFVDPRKLKDDPRIGIFDFRINLSESPVRGGIRLHEMQERAGGIPLWRDQIPELSIRVMKDGRYQRFTLVARGTTIKPIRGQAIRIPINESFTLPPGKRFYQFPLYQGADADELKYSARLDSPAFPLKSAVDCELTLTFQYGADEPYALLFVPRDKSLSPVRATWQRTQEILVTDAPSPEYPKPMSWEDLRRVPKPGGKDTSDLLGWVRDATTRFHRSLFREVGQITSLWRKDKHDRHYAFARLNDGTTDVFIHESSLAEGFSYRDFQTGSTVSLELCEQGGKYAAQRVATADFREPTHSVVERIRKGLYFPVIQIWRDGRSISDPDCPPEFANFMRCIIPYFTRLLQDTGISDQIQRELLFLLACMHKDMPDETIHRITDQVERGVMRDPRMIGFALGDVSEMWQQHLFRTLASKPNQMAISAFAYAIWREQHLVEHFTLSELNALLNALLRRLRKIPSPMTQTSAHNNRGMSLRPRDIAEGLELLLGLLRTRASNDKDIRMLLQPHQRITQLLAKQVDRVDDILAESRITLLSRVQIDLQKPEGVRTPDLLYALRLYLTGDDGANTIHVAGISDNDDN